MRNDDCIFCKIVKGESPSFKVWEDTKHLAFLSIFPNTEGATILITKKHYPSYIADLPKKVAADLLLASRKVAKLLDKKLDDVGRTGIVFEGMGVNHIHAKIFPMHGTKEYIKNWIPFPKPAIDTYFEKYEGYLSTHSSHTKADDQPLEKLAKKIRGK